MTELTQQRKEQAEFESESLRYPLPLDKDKAGRYISNDTFIAYTFFRIGRSSLESENAELRKLLRNLLAADGHSLTPQCSFTGCNCGGVEKYKVARSEAVGAIRGGTNGDPK